MMIQMNKQSLNVLAFGAHADDVEIGMAGTISKLTSEGHRVGICDLTDADLSSNGNTALRKEEGSHAAEILGVSMRLSLSFPDRGLYLKEEYINQIASIIRSHKPKIVFAPYFEDRHPDHGNCARLVEEAVFSAGIRKYKTAGNEEPHRVEKFYFYMINGFHMPDFTIDITYFMNNKLAALRAYKSQFEQTEQSFATPLVNGYIETVEARERMFGKLVGVTFAEGFKTKVPILLKHDLIGD
jgi:bacillithiol biosynthesis deacetylase BshB1